MYYIQYHHYLFSGEPSSGKSTLINRITGKQILNSGNLVSPAIVFKLRNSERVKIVVEHMSGKIEEKDLTDKCDPNTEEGQKILRKTLKKLSDVESSAENRTVEIHLPIPFLKVIL